MDKKIVTSSQAPVPIGPYSQAVRTGNTLYCSGQIGLDPVSGQMVQNTLQDETRRVMLNIGEVLKAAGMDFSNIVKCTIYLTTLDDFAAVNAIYGSYFKGDFPARETVAVSALPKGARVEISVVAVEKPF